MASFNTPEALYYHLLTVLKRSMKPVGESIAEVVKKRTEIDVYGAGTPRKYTRTYELRDSIVAREPKKDADSVSVEVNHDLSKIKAIPDMFVHGSRYWTPYDFSEYLPETVHYGKSGKLFGEGYWRQRRPYFDNAFAELEKNNRHFETLRRTLRDKGYKVF